VDYQPVLAAKAASQKPAGWPRLKAEALLRQMADHGFCISL